MKHFLGLSTDITKKQPVSIAKAWQQIVLKIPNINFHKSQ